MFDNKINCYKIDTSTNAVGKVTQVLKNQDQS